MGDKRETYVTAWTSAQERALLQQGWTQVGRTLLLDLSGDRDAALRGFHAVLAPPEPPKPTLAERLDGVIDAADPHDIDCVPIFDAKAELRRLTKIEAAARYAVDHQTECGVVERLRNALER